MIFIYIEFYLSKIYLFIFLLQISNKNCSDLHRPEQSHYKYFIPLCPFRAFAPFATFGATKVVQKRLFTPSIKKREAYFQPFSGTYSVKLNPSIICKSAGFFVPIQVKSPVSTFFSIVILFFVTLTFTKSPCSKPYFFKYSPLMFMAFVYLFPCADLQTVRSFSIFNSNCNGLLILP